MRGNAAQSLFTLVDLRINSLSCALLFYANGKKQFLLRTSEHYELHHKQYGTFKMETDKAQTDVFWGTLTLTKKELKDPFNPETYRLCLNHLLHWTSIKVL